MAFERRLIRTYWKRCLSAIRNFGSVSSPETCSLSLLFLRLIKFISFISYIALIFHLVIAQSILAYLQEEVTKLVLPFYLSYSLS